MFVFPPRFYPFRKYKRLPSYLLTLLFFLISMNIRKGKILSYIKPNFAHLAFDVPIIQYIILPFSEVILSYPGLYFCYLLALMVTIILNIPIFCSPYMIYVFLQKEYVLFPDIYFDCFCNIRFSVFP